MIGKESEITNEFTYHSLGIYEKHKLTIPNHTLKLNIIATLYNYVL